MAKLFFRYGAMSCGKSLDLLRVAYNYEEHGKKVLIFTSAKDNRYGENLVKSRTGLEKPAIGVTDDMNIFEYVNNYESVDCVLVDEVQFLKKHHIYELSHIVDKFDIPVIAYGLRSDFMTEPFEGSTYMLILADEIEELKTLCKCCDKKAIFNIRYTIKEGTRGYFKSIVTEGAQVQIGGNDSYMPLCRKCYKELLDITEKVKQKDISIIPDGHYCYTPIGHSKKGYKIKPCPYFDTIKNGEYQNDGYCHFIEEGDVNLDGSDREGGFGLLWDQVKSCSINNDD